jgi:hypothetical protein
MTEVINQKRDINGNIDYTSNGITYKMINDVFDVHIIPSRRRL